jgi:hypothetical protein
MEATSSYLKTRNPYVRILSFLILLFLIEDINGNIIFCLHKTDQSSKIDGRESDTFLTEVKNTARGKELA